MTVLDASRTTGNGFVFAPHTSAALAGAIAEAVRFYREPGRPDGPAWSGARGPRGVAWFT